MSHPHSPNNPQVEQQYTDWVYPDPITDIAEWKAKGGHPVCDPSTHHAMLWPECAYRADISVLVAGCGSSQAAILAYNNPNTPILGIDLSETSLGYTAALKDKHQLSNLELRKMDLHEVGKLGKTFDLIYSTGVLHHLPDPAHGLCALRGALADDGVMCLMLYGKYLRAGVYWIQDVLRRLQVGQSREGIEFTRTLIASLPSWHAVQAYLQSAAVDLLGDGGLVDTFLHPQDVAYSVPEVLQVMDACGLSFQGWGDNILYYPDALIPKDHVLYQRMKGLPEEEQWAIVEMVMQNIGCHNFIARAKAQDDSAFRIHMERPSFLKTIPQRKFGTFIKEEGHVIDLRRSWHQMKLEGIEREMYKAVDGTATVEDLIARHGKGSPDALEFFKRMNRLGHLTFSQRG